jgi:phosphoglycerol transferase MdoB-like AlkP superfamily enzyme
MDTKYCFKCKQVKHLTEFNINKKPKYFNQCKKCYNNKFINEIITKQSPEEKEKSDKFKKELDECFKYILKQSGKSFEIIYPDGFTIGVMKDF